MSSSSFRGRRTLSKGSGQSIAFKKVALVPMKELEGLTGYIRGGVSAIGAKKNFPVLLSDRAIHEPLIIISAGKRGHQVRLNPHDFYLSLRGFSLRTAEFRLLIMV